MFSCVNNSLILIVKLVEVKTTNGGKPAFWKFACDLEALTYNSYANSVCGYQVKHIISQLHTMAQLLSSQHCSISFLSSKLSKIFKYFVVDPNSNYARLKRKQFINTKKHAIKGEIKY